jgi:hypothetical protein
MASRLENAKREIVEYLQGSGKTVYTFNDLANALSTNRIDWKLPDTTSGRKFVSFLSDKAGLQELRFYSRTYLPVVRYAWPGVTAYELALSLRPRSFLSHGTALFFHDLTEQVPTTIYVNREQTPKQVGGPISQSGIDRAFSSKQRRSNYIYEYKSWRFVLLSGKDTGRYGVVKVTTSEGGPIEVTNLERTLIDVVVRPAYAGGIYAVLDAFRLARERVSGTHLLRTLDKMNFAYPYHQAIGFLMEKAGYEEKLCRAMKGRGIDFDFYVAHGIAEKQYDPKWRLFYPKGF